MCSIHLEARPRPSEKLAQRPYFRISPVFPNCPFAWHRATGATPAPLVSFGPMSPWSTHPASGLAQPWTLNHGGPSAPGTHTGELFTLPDAASREGWMVLLWRYVVTYHWEALSGIKGLLLQCRGESKSFQVWKTGLRSQKFYYGLWVKYWMSSFTQHQCFCLPACLIEIPVAMFYFCTFSMEYYQPRVGISPWNMTSETEGPSFPMSYAVLISLRWRWSCVAGGCCIG